MISDISDEIQGHILRYACNIDTISGIKTIASLRQVSRRYYSLVEDHYIMGVEKTEETVWNTLRYRYDYIRLNILHFHNNKKEVYEDIIVVKRKCKSIDIFKTIHETIDLEYESQSIYFIPNYERWIQKIDYQIMDIEYTPFWIDNIANYTLHNDAYIVYSSTNMLEQILYKKRRYYENDRYVCEYIERNDDSLCVMMERCDLSHSYNRFIKELIVKRMNNKNILDKMDKDRERIKRDGGNSMIRLRI